VTCVRVDRSASVALALTGKKQVCGFAAVLSLTEQKPDAALAARMAGLLAHRGPDDCGTYVDHPLALGFRRLSIQDLAPSGHQPMVSGDGRYVIVFNGEIYNFVELRAELAALGHVFRSSGDTEVLLTAYVRWGAQCLSRLNGMWAFIVYDRLERRMFGARDRFGVKPLYWYRDSRNLLVASEIKAIRDCGSVQLDVNWRTVARHLLDDQLDVSEQTFYRDVEQVPAGSAFEIDGAGSIRQWRYWSLAELREDAAAIRDPVESFRSLFDDAVRLRMRSDVPVGVQLSGGMDSTSIISSMASQLATVPGGAHGLHAFCYMAPQFDETAQIRATLQQTGAHLVPLASTPHELWSVIEKHLWHQDEPVHSFTSVVGYQLMRLARSHGVKVLLNGQGADEVLAGYRNYFTDYWAEIMRAGRPLEARRAIRSFALAHGGSPRALAATALLKACSSYLRKIPGYAPLAALRADARVRANPWVSQEVKRHWMKATVPACNDLNSSLRYSVEIDSLPLYLRVEDRNSMAHGVEVRLPFLDYRLVTLAFSLGSRWKLDGHQTKVLLREAMRGRIPEIVRAQVRKLGFPTPVDEWFRGPLYGPLRDLLVSRNVRESQLWQHATLERALERHRRGEANLGARLFDVAQVCLWMEGIRQWPAMAQRSAVTVAARAT
jgi:asparagine synthase (glutamine-hydrolysing)